MSERTALLNKPTTPLPKMQLFLLFFIRMTDPVAFNCIFPFVQQMILDIGAVEDPEKVGYYAGLVESIFSLVQLFTIFHWGALSDRIGRKPVLIIGCFGCAISGIAFGFSTTFWQMCLARSLNGLFNGNIAILKAAIGEITDETNEARAFSLFPICLNTGIIIAAYIGGTFAGTRGTVIGNAIPLFDKYPYALPMLLSSLFPLISGIAALFFLKETLPADLHKENEQASAEDKSLKKLMTRHISLIIFSFGVLSLLGIGISALLPLFCFTPVDHGGLGFKAKTIGNVISQRSVTVLVIQMVAFPWFQKRVGTTRLFKWLMTLWVPTMLLLPLCNLAARMGNDLLMWAGLYLFMIVGSLAGMAFVCNLLMTNAAAPSPQLLGAINGYAQVISCLVGIIGPGGFTSLFALSVDKNVLGGNLIWIATTAVAALGAVSGFLIHDPDAQGQIQV